MKPAIKPKTIDQYIAGFPKETQTILEEMRRAIREAAPNAVETISYQMPAFKQNKVLVWFAAFRNHIGFFPTALGVEAFRARLGSYKISKGTIQFSKDQPIPLDLVKEIVRYRVEQIQNPTKKP
jgi:uncharacterized protein YdhG (YjbR/CyaY superfamily)